MSEIEKKEMDLAAKDFEEEKDKYKYIAFISYRHLEPDSTIAKKIHTMIETFKLPKEFYIGGEKPNFRVFRDREELTTSSLSSSIEYALRNSKFLIVICSKRLPLSQWCNREVETFIKLHGIDRIIPVLIEGEPEEAFPKAILGESEEIELEDGTVEINNKDILAAEFRPESVLSEDFEGYEYLEKNNKSKLKEITKEALRLMDVEKYRIMAAILGVSYGDLRQRDKLRRQKRLLTLSGIVGVALLFFTIFMYNAYKNENIAKRQTIQDKASFMLDKSEELLKTGDKLKSLILSDNAVKDLDEDMADFKKLTDRHKQLLNNSLNLINPVFDKTIVTNNQFTFIDINKSGDKLVAGLDNDSIGIWDIETGNLIKKATGHKQQVKIVEFSKDEKTIASGGFDGIINVWDADSLKVKVSKQVEGNIMLLNHSDDNKYLEVIEDRDGKYFYQRYDIKNLEYAGKTILLDGLIKRVIFDKDNQYMWVCYITNPAFQKNKSLVKYDLTSGKKLKAYGEDSRVVEDFTEDKKENQSKNMKKENIAYIDIAKSNDGKSIYAFNSKFLKKIDSKTDDIVFKSEELANSFKDELLLLESYDKKSLYAPTLQNIIKMDANTGEKILEIKTNLNDISWLARSKNVNSVAVLSKDGEVSIIKDDKIKESISKLDSGRSEYLYLTPNGKNIITLSLTETKIKIAKVDRKHKLKKIKGQIVAVSDNQKYILLLNDMKYEVWDISKEEKLYEIKNEKLAELAYLLDDNKLKISDDARFIAGIESLINTKTKLEKSELFVIDTKTSKTVYTNDMAKYKAKFGFSPDSSLVYFSKGLNQIYICSIKEKKVVSEIKTKSNYFTKIKMSEQNKYIYANFNEGIGEVYDINDKKIKGSVVGSILNIKLDGKKILLDVIYNNEISKYKDFVKDEESILLTDKRSEHGVSLDEEIFLNPEKNLMLSIKSKDKMHYFYLIDYKTGDLIQSFDVSLNQYKPMGFISPNGEKIGFDYSFDLSEISDKNQLETDINMVVYPIINYDNLKKLSEKELTNIRLTDKEKDELNIE